LASAVATFLFVLSFFFQLGAMNLAPLAAQAPGSMAASSAGSAENPPIIIWEGSSNQAIPQGLGGGYGGGGPVGGASIAPQVTEATPNGSRDATGNAPTFTPQPSEAPTAAALLAVPQTAEKSAPTLADAESSGPILGIAPANERGKIVEPTTSAALSSGRAMTQTGFEWIWVQAGLGALALLTALVGFVLWRRARH